MPAIPSARSTRSARPAAPSAELARSGVGWRRGGTLVDVLEQFAARLVAAVEQPADLAPDPLLRGEVRGQLEPQRFEHSPAVGVDRGLDSLAVLDRRSQAHVVDELRQRHGYRASEG